MAARPPLSFKHAVNTVVGALATGFLRTVRVANPEWLANVSAATMRRLGPWLKEHNVGRDNLKAAYPNMPPDEIERILDGVWENLGRFGAEFAHLDRLWDPEISQHGNDRIDWSEESRHRALDLKAKGQPALLFAAHLANWELAAVGAHQLGFKTAVLYRPPNVSAVAEAAVEMRARLMGTLIPTDFTAPIRIAEEIGRGSLVGMLVDQYHTKGVDVTFFGRPARTNPLIARLARQFECPIYGVRSVRLPEGRIRLELTRPIDVPRDADGRIDIAGTMQRINDVVEGWVREHPEQWLWVHRRWR
jgi:Kdo2-lipid IVA lauroyltransferase/acyltransferase